LLGHYPPTLTHCGTPLAFASGYPYHPYAVKLLGSVGFERSVMKRLSVLLLPVLMAVMCLALFGQAPQGGAAGGGGGQGRGGGGGRGGAGGGRGAPAAP